MKYLLLVLFLLGCKEDVKTTHYGNNFDVKCYSGGKLIYEGHAFYSVISNESGAPVYFQQENRDAVMSTADCMFIRKADQ